MDQNIFEGLMLLNCEADIVSEWHSIMDELVNSSNELKRILL